jgi:hypothetical protein
MIFLNEADFVFELQTIRHIRIDLPLLAESKITEEQIKEIDELIDKYAEICAQTCIDSHRCKYLFDLWARVYPHVPYHVGRGRKYLFGSDKTVIDHTHSSYCDYITQIIEYFKTYSGQGTSFTMLAKAGEALKEALGEDVVRDTWGPTFKSDDLIGTDGRIYSESLYNACIELGKMVLAEPSLNEQSRFNSALKVGCYALYEIGFIFGIDVLSPLRRWIRLASRLATSNPNMRNVLSWRRSVPEVFDNWAVCDHVMTLRDTATYRTVPFTGSPLSYAASYLGLWVQITHAITIDLFWNVKHIYANRSWFWWMNRKSDAINMYKESEKYLNRGHSIITDILFTQLTDTPENYYCTPLCDVQRGDYTELCLRSYVVPHL